MAAISDPFQIIIIVALVALTLAAFLYSIIRVAVRNALKRRGSSGTPSSSTAEFGQS